MMLPASVVRTVALLFLIICGVVGQYRGERCRFRHSRQRGRCMFLNRCPSAIQQVRQNFRPQLCGFEGNEPVVCCSRKAEDISGLPVPTPQPPVSKPPGTTCKQKCQEYTNIKTNTGFQTTLVGGEEAVSKEFPHMAALGFGEENDIQWQCGGTLISEEFVLTAAHCLYSQEYGDVKYVRLGALDLKSASKSTGTQDFQVNLVYRNPEYRPPSQYNDIALIRLDRPVEITAYVKPACLQTEYNLPNNSLPIATGWGRLSYTGETSDKLMKVTLSYFNNDQCSQVYRNVPQRRLSNGIVDATQLCAGGINESKDTCQGDSGGPLQIRDFDNPKQFYIIGVTSFGKGCGIENIPGVYTRVSNYISWIEETVWPNSKK